MNQVKYIFIYCLLSTSLSFNDQAMADGNRLLSSCNVALNLTDNSEWKGDPYDAGFCIGLIQGVHQLNGLYQSYLKETKPLFCLPKEGINNGQAIRIVDKYLRDHPERLHELEIALTFSAFRDAFPCIK